MTTTTLTAEAAGYLAAVRAQLDDLNEEDRADLLEDLAQHLDDISSDPDPDTPLTTRLGPPARYAAELRAAAGLHARVEQEAGPDPVDGRGGSWDPKAAIALLWKSAPIAAVRAFVPQLRPGWWVLRGFLVVAVPALWSPNSADDFPFPSVGGSRVIGVLSVTAAIVASVALGQRAKRLPARLLMALGNMALIVLTAALLVAAEPRLAMQVVKTYPTVRPQDELTSRHGAVTNIFPYAADGTPLANVLLFDQDGRPLRSEKQLWWPERCNRDVWYPLAADGVAVEFAYPKNYVLIESARTVPNRGVVEGPPPRACPEEMPRPTVPLPVMAPSPPG